MYIPVAEPAIGKEELNLIIKTVKSGWISSIGKNITKFENKFAKFCDAKYGVTTTNGTSALHLCLEASEIGPGDEVIVPSMTFVATANAVVYTGAKPVFVDSEIETWNIDAHKIEGKINDQTKAIIPVHLYGHPANMDKIIEIARKHELLVFEDAAEAHGANYKGNKVGTLGNAGCFSFYGNKIITTGEGGMVVTNNKNFAEKVRSLRDHGESGKRKYYYPQLGFNYAMTNMQAAIGLAQLKKIDQIIKKKRKIYNIYNKHLSPLVPKIKLSPEAEWAKSVFWMFSILVPPEGKINRDVLSSKLRKKGIDTRPFFYPLHKYKRFGSNEELPVSSYLGKAGINLPSSPNLSEKEIKYVCNEIINILK